MRQVIQIRDKTRIHEYLKKDTNLHIYEIGDLDDFFFNHTSWWTLENENEICSLAMLYQSPDLPTLLVLNNNVYLSKELVTKLLPYLPHRFYCHLSPELESAFSNNFSLDHHGLHLKMILKNENILNRVSIKDVVELDVANLEDIYNLYQKSYPGNWFDQRMLETGMYYGLYIDSNLVSIAGIHVYSPQYGVASLGNITTHPDHRGKGFASKVTTALCLSLLKKVNIIGLNVSAQNAGAISCYEKLGFEKYANYNEYMLNSI